MKPSAGVLLAFLVLLACAPESPEPGEVKAVLRGYQDDTYNLCFGWLFEVGTELLPARQVPSEFRGQQNVAVWLRYQPDTVSVSAKWLPRCHLINVLSLRKRT